MKRTQETRTKGSIRFALKEPKGDKPTPINLEFSYGRGKRAKRSTGFKVHPSNFDFERYRVRKSLKVKDFRIINNKLSELENEIHKIISDFESKDMFFGIEDIMEAYDIYIGKSSFEEEVKTKPHKFFDYIDYFIENKSRMLKKGSNGRKNATVKSYEQTRKHLKEYESFSDSKLTFDSIDLEFYYDFLDYMNTKTYGKNDDHYSLNTIGKHIKNLIVFLNSSLNDGVNSNMIFRHREFKAPTELTTSIFLTNQEIKKIAQYDFSERKDLELARDIFLIGCEIGQRVSDYNGIGDLDFIRGENDDMYIKITQQKTGKVVNCFITDLMKKIMERYEGRFPPYLYEQDINERLKIIARKVKLNDVIYFERTEGGKLIKTRKYKWELVSSHTARRSFCTNKFLSGMRIGDIMHLSGHTTEKEFSKYIRITSLERTKSIVDTDNFRKSLIKLND